MIAPALKLDDVPFAAAPAPAPAPGSPVAPVSSGSLGVAEEAPRSSRIAAAYDYPEAASNAVSSANAAPVVPVAPTRLPL